MAIAIAGYGLYLLRRVDPELVFTAIRLIYGNCPFLPNARRVSNNGLHNRCLLISGCRNLIPIGGLESIVAKLNCNCCCEQSLVAINRPCLHNGSVCRNWAWKAQYSLLSRGTRLIVASQAEPDVHDIITAPSPARLVGHLAQTARRLR